MENEGFDLARLAALDWSDPLKAAGELYTLCATHGLAILEGRDGELQLRMQARTPSALAAVAKAHEQELLHYLRERQQ